MNSINKPLFFCYANIIQEIPNCQSCDNIFDLHCIWFGIVAKCLNNPICYSYLFPNIALVLLNCGRWGLPTRPEWVLAPERGAGFSKLGPWQRAGLRASAWALGAGIKVLPPAPDRGAGIGRQPNSSFGWLYLGWRPGDSGALEAAHIAVGFDSGCI